MDALLPVHCLHLCGALINRHSVDIWWIVHSNRICAAPAKGISVKLGWHNSTCLPSVAFQSFLHLIGRKFPQKELRRSSTAAHTKQHTRYYLSCESLGRTSKPPKRIHRPPARGLQLHYLRPPAPDSCE